jgi:hypothetical protein
MWADVCGRLIVAGLVSVFIMFWKGLGFIGLSRERRQCTYEQIADEFDLWNRYVNDRPGGARGELTRLEHAQLSKEEKIELLTDQFGKEKQK